MVSIDVLQFAKWLAAFGQSTTMVNFYSIRAARIARLYRP